MSFTARDFPLTTFPIVFPGSSKLSLNDPVIESLFSLTHNPDFHIRGSAYAGLNFNITFSNAHPVMLSTLVTLYSQIQELVPGLPVTFELGDPTE